MTIRADLVEAKDKRIAEFESGIEEIEHLNVLLDWSRPNIEIGLIDDSQ